MSSHSPEIKKRPTLENEPLPSRRNPARKRRRKTHIIRESMDIAKGVVVLSWGSFSAKEIGMYDPSHKRNLESRNPCNSRIDFSWTQRLPGVPTSLDFISRCSERTRIRIAERLSKHKDLENIMSHISSYLSNLHIRQRLEDPPPLLFVVACATFVLAVTTFRQSHRADRYQDQIIIAGVALGTILAAVETESFVMDLKGCLAWSIIGALGFSSLFHRVLSWWPDPEISRHGPEKEELVVLEDEVHSES